MNAETKLLKKIVRAISHNPENIRDYNWIEITNEFDYETMDRLICEIKYDFVVDEVVSCILSAWDDALQHRDPRCLVPDSLRPQIKVAKYRGEHSLEYELNNIKKTRILEKDLKKEEARPLPFPFPDDNNNPNNQLGQHNIQQSAPADTGEIEKLNKQLSEEKEINAKLEEKIKALEIQLQPDEDFPEGMKLGIDERIIFVSAALGVTLSAADINQTKLAQAIAYFSGDKCKSIRSRIVNLNNELKKETNAPGKGLSQGTLEAVKNVKEWLKIIGKTEIAPATKKLIEEIDDMYLNKKE